METLFNKKETIELWKKGTPQEKSLLEKLYGKEIFVPAIKYTDIEDFLDAVKMLKNSHTKIGDELIEEYQNVFNIFPEGTYYHALAQLRIIIFAINGCDEAFPNWDDSVEEKRFPWFVLESDSAKFLFAGAHYICSASVVGSRLVFKDNERCKYVAEHKNFNPLYKIFFNQ